MSKKKKLSRIEVSKAAFNEAVQSFSESMPLLMHGCGDVTPNHVNQDTAKLVASLTADYISSLTDAAIRVQRLQSPESLLTAPPPRFPKSLQPLAPPPQNDSMTTTNHQRKRPRRSTDEYWDEPLPAPKIKNQAASSNRSSLAWVGLAGCDFSSRTRSVFVSECHALSTRTFLFPICHDAYAYGRVTQLQASKRALVPLLTDAATMELMKTEGVLVRTKKATKDRRKKKAIAADDDDEDDDEQDVNEDDDEDNESANSDEEDGGPTWTGLDDLLPSYRTRTEHDVELEPNVESSLFCNI
ncbi:hypothetical protein MPSEU_000338700 [Mayamaea pseudoterrestris]|nr:hypothetical protein MPSEU_000338700 [Mayamaea pseudoterrestris]